LKIISECSKGCEEVVLDLLDRSVINKRLIDIFQNTLKKYVKDYDFKG